jgi:hypothetical protein
VPPHTWPPRGDHRRHALTAALGPDHLGRGWSARPGPLSLVAGSASRATVSLGLWPWAEGWPSAGLIFFLFRIGLNNSINSMKFLNYKENKIKLIKIQNKFR